MAGRIPPEFIDALLARTDIVDLINHRVPLRKGGKDYQACCPFHDEKTPSFTVSREKQFYHCFGCGAHGTAIGFLMEYDRLGFLDAVEELARQAGMELPSGGEAAHSGPNLAPLYELLERVARIYRGQLKHHPQATRAIDYLRARGLTGEVAAAFGLGYAPPGWDFLQSTLGTDTGLRERLLQCGLMIEQEGRRYDRFRDRVMFPIRDRRGRVIGFGGRILGEGKPKYLNSPETPVFHKGRELYGLHETLRALKNPERLLVVEGYMDVIALAQFGINYAVATLGTATTDEHLQTLLRSAPELVFCFDGDRAGRAAAWKALETVLPQATGRQQVRFLFLPEGEDPDTLIRREGRDAFEERAKAAAPLSEFLFRQLTAQVDMESLDGRARLGELARPLLGKVPPGVFRDLLDARLATLVGVATSQPATSNRDTRRRSRTAPRKQPLTPLRLAIALLLQNPHIASQANQVPALWRRLDRPGIQPLAQTIDLIAAHPEINTATLLERWRGQEMYTHLERLADPTLLTHIPEEGLAAELTGALQRLNAETANAETERLFARNSPAQWTEEEKDRLRGTAASAGEDHPGSG
jgi:DNA primase